MQMSNFLVNFPDFVLLIHGSFPILFQACMVWGMNMEDTKQCFLQCSLFAFYARSEVGFNEAIA